MSRIPTRGPLPPLLSSRPLASASRRRGYLAYFLLVLILWGLATAAALFVVARESFFSARAEFESRAQEAHGHLRDRLQANDMALFNFAGLLSTLGAGDRDRAAGLARALVERYPHIYQMQVVRKLGHRELPAFVEQMRRGGFPDFQPKTFSYESDRRFQPLGTREQYYLLVFMEPALPAARPVLGLDVGAVPFLAKGLNDAAAKGRSLASPLFELAEGGGAAYTMFRPVGRGSHGAAAGLFGGESHALLVILAATLEPPLEIRDPRIAYGLRHRGYVETAFGDSLFSLPATPASPLERALFPQLRVERDYSDVDVPFQFVMTRQMGFADLRSGGLVAALGLAAGALGALLLHFRTVARQGRLLREHEERILHLALHDQLTGLPNRRLLDDRLQHAVDIARRQNDHVGVFFLDLDGFKPANDRYGHAIGDAILKEVSRRLAASIRDADTVARYGGDEFVLVCSGLQHAADALAVGEKIRLAVNAAYQVEGHSVTITPSIGVSVFPDNADDAYTLLNQADVAMYRAKSQGRNRVRLYHEEVLA